MIPLLVIIGAGAALELKRFLHKNPRDVVEAQQNEKRVKKLVEVSQMHFARSGSHVLL